VINNEKKATEPKKESAAGSEQTSPVATTEKSQVSSAERTKESQSIQSETQVFSDKKLLPKTGSSRRQNLFFYNFRRNSFIVNANFVQKNEP
jgi:hypothetical protein